MSSYSAAMALATRKPMLSSPSSPAMATSSSRSTPTNPMSRAHSTPNMEYSIDYYSTTSLARLTARPNITTSMSAGGNPASAVSNSSRNSPISTPSNLGTSTSVRTSPDGPLGLEGSQLSFVHGLMLPDPMSFPSPVYPSLNSPPPPSSSMSDALALSKGVGIVRRISQGATSRIRRRRGSGTNSRRDQSCGPVTMRRQRSDSRSAVVDDCNDVSEFELESPSEEANDDFGEPLTRENLILSQTRPGPNSVPEGGYGPIKSTILEEGTPLIKVTKKGLKKIKFCLDFETAKVYWEPSRPSKRFYVDDVREIRTGVQARHYREEFNVSANFEPLWFTIIYLDPDHSKGKGLRTIHLCAPDNFTFKLWISTLEAVSRSRIETMASLLGSPEKTVRRLWQRAMDQKRTPTREYTSYPEDRLELPGVMKICRSLQINCSEVYLRFQFDQADADLVGALTLQQLLQMLKLLRERRDIRQIYNTIKPTDAPDLDQAHFFKFLSEHQGIDVDANMEHWISLFDRYARPSPKQKSPVSTPSPSSSASRDSLFDRAPGMSQSAFQSFLNSSSSNPALIVDISEPALDRPLNEYFISSSHNTYLLGRQIAGISSVEAYVSALQKGCRCIEIDCWEGENGPLVSHGRTLTTSVQFTDCIKVVAKYAFVSSPYPLTLSIENHCGPIQQAIMAEEMKKAFGDSLILQPLDSESTILPSPEQLRGKILVKVKVPEEAEEKISSQSKSIRTRRRSFSSPFARPAIPSSEFLAATPNTLVSSPPIPRSIPMGRMHTSESLPRSSATFPASFPSSFVSSGEEEEVVADATKTKKVTKALGQLAVYTRGVKFHDFSAPEATTYNHIFSVAEKALEKLCKHESGAKENRTKEMLERHNLGHLMRVYPKASRISSSNFNPIAMWRRGVQMAALNFQTFDTGMQINDAMFAAGHDRTGYVLKPEELRNSRLLSKKPKKLVNFTVDIISAQQLPRPRDRNGDTKINPYITFEVFFPEGLPKGASYDADGEGMTANGQEASATTFTQRTRVVDGNGYDPTFSEKVQVSIVTKYPSLVFLRWTVWNSTDGRNPKPTGAPLATFTAKLSQLQQGYRHFPLFDANGEQYLFSRLFCRIQKEAIIVADHALARMLPNVIENPSPLQEPKGSKTGSIFRRVLHRQPSERRKKEQSEQSFFSRSSTMEKRSDY